MRAKLLDSQKITTIENGGFINRRNVLCGSALKKPRPAKARFFLWMPKRAESISAWNEEPTGLTREPWRKIPLILVLPLVISSSLFVSARALAEFDVTELLGRSVASPIVSDFEQQMGCVYSNYIYENFLCKNTGVEYSIDTRELKVVAVWLYAEGVDGYSAFRGQIPLGLAWGMTPQQVEARLGPPQRVLSVDGRTAQYRFTNLPFKAELTYYTDNPRLGRVLFTNKR